jgi:hypothetical protein
VGRALSSPVLLLATRLEEGAEFRVVEYRVAGIGDVERVPIVGAKHVVIVIVSYVDVVIARAVEDYILVFRCALNERVLV